MEIYPDQPTRKMKPKGRELRLSYDEGLDFCSALIQKAQVLVRRTAYFQAEAVAQLGLYG